MEAPQKNLEPVADRKQALSNEDVRYLTQKAEESAIAAFGGRKLSVRQ